MIEKREIVFSTRWFEVEAKHDGSGGDPYYSLKLPDYVCVVAYTADGQMVLVKQYRHAVEAELLELPSGLVDTPGGPEATARRELEEETGYAAGEMAHLGTLHPDTGRLQNRLWCYLARGARAIPNWRPERGIQPVLMSPQDVSDAIAEGRFNHALHLAALQLASRYV